MDISDLCAFYNDLDHYGNTVHVPSSLKTSEFTQDEFIDWARRDCKQ